MTDADASAELIAQVRAIVADTLGLPPERLDDRADLAEDYRADSLLFIELLTRLEKQYDLEFAPGDQLAMRSVERIVETLGRYLAPVTR